MQHEPIESVVREIGIIARWYQDSRSTVFKSVLAAVVAAITIAVGTAFASTHPNAKDLARMVLYGMAYGNLFAIMVDVAILHMVYKSVSRGLDAQVMWQSLANSDVKLESFDLIRGSIVLNLRFVIMYLFFFVLAAVALKAPEIFHLDGPL